jgi:hypothetical protein
MSGITGRAGPNYERNIVTYINRETGLDWERMPAQGNRDLLDLQGPLAAGWLVGCKAIQRATTQDVRMWKAMDQCQRAMVNLEHKWGRTPVGVIPVQILQRPASKRPDGADAAGGYGRSYVVTELDWWLDLVELRLRLEAGPSPLRGRLEAGR